MAVMTPFVLFLILAMLIYLPPVQQWAVHTASTWAEEETGYAVSVGEVRLAFPLDLVLVDLSVRDSDHDELLRSEAIRLKVPIRPLLQSRVDVDGFFLKQAQVNTKSLISDVHVEGSLCRADISLHGYEWKDNLLRGITADISGADVQVVITDTAAPDTTPSAPWIIELNKARIRDSRVNIRMAGSSIGVDIRDAVARKGYFDTGSMKYTLQHLDFHTAGLQYDDFKAPALKLQLDSLYYSPDFLRGVVSSTIYDSLYTHRNVAVRAAVDGSLEHLHLRALSVSAPRLLTATVSGDLEQVLEDTRRGTVNLQLTTGDQLTAFLHPYIGNDIRVPSQSRLTGVVELCDRDTYATRLTLKSAGGSAVMRGRVNISTEQYNLAAIVRQLPLRQFVPSLPVKPLTAQLSARGRGFDILSSRARLELKADVNQFQYDVYPLNNTTLEASLRDSDVSTRFRMDNAMMQGEGLVRANLHKGYEAYVDACLIEFRPFVVGLTTDSLTLGATFTGNLKSSKDLRTLQSDGLLADICFMARDTMARARDIYYNVSFSPDSSFADLRSGDLTLEFTSSGSIDSVVRRSMLFADEIVHELKVKELDQHRLAQLLPTANLRLVAGQENPLAAYVRMMGHRMTSLDVLLGASPQNGLAGHIDLGALTIGTLRLDTIHSDILQDEDGVKLMVNIENRKKDNPNRFTAQVDAYALASGAGADLVFKDEQGRVGVDLGLTAIVEDEGFNLHIYPRTPIIAYRRFTINDDNFVFLGRDSTLRANVDIIADDGTGLKLYGEPTAEGNNDLTLSINRLNLGELSSVLPSMPVLGGYLSGDCHVTQDRQNLSAMLSLGMDDFAYDGVKLGNLGSEIIYLPKQGGEHYAEAYLSYEGDEVLKASGSYFSEGEGRFSGDVHLVDLPLQLANAFLTDVDAAMRGSAMGDFHAEGPVSKPVLNGSLTVQDAHLYSPVYSFDFSLDERPIVVQNSRLNFHDYKLSTQGKSPFLINGDINAQDLSNISIDLTMATQNFELINAKRTREAQVFGKVYADFDGSVRGTLGSLKVRGNLAIQEGTNVTYIMRDTPVSVGDEFEGLVSFVNFADTTKVETPATQNMDLDVACGIVINDAAQVHCLLAEDGKSYVDIMGGGNLNFKYTRQGDMNLTGRYTIYSGEMKYELPIIPLKTFTLTSGSYVEFKGDVLNPTLNIQALERTKATVTTDGSRRSVPFNVGVAISQDLDNLGLEFLIASPEDGSVQSELDAMTEMQRGQAAVTMLVTGMYMPDGANSLVTQSGGGGGFSSNNTLNTFLLNGIQSIAGSALQSIDLNFDIDTNSNSSGGTTTDYNFAFAKRFWGDRISVILGGRVSSGAEAHNTAASIIDNVSVEYRLDKGATRYVRVFYDRTAHDALEGTLMETGAGLVLRRKTNRLGELFLFRRK